MDSWLLCPFWGTLFMELDSHSLSSTDVLKINTQASVFMKKGIRLMDHTRPEAIAAALRCFDQALELRRRLPIETSPMLRYGLAACWLNRADALMHLETSEQTQMALCSYDEALTLLRDLPLHEDARFPRRLAIAYQNRGLALQSQDASAIAQAMQEFSKAIAILEDEHAAQISDRLYLLAAVWMNLANAGLAEASTQSVKRAEEAAYRAITLVADLETNDVHIAEVGMKARHVLCHTIARRLSQITDRDARMPSDVHDATDAADDGLALARRWEQKGVARFREIAVDLFRFGIRVYAKYQPQFLREFISDNMDPSRSCREYVESPAMCMAAQEGLTACGRMGGHERRTRNV
jgi:tetratricopeptide (TPR) repeat protein